MARGHFVSDTTRIRGSQVSEHGGPIDPFADTGQRWNWRRGLDSAFVGELVSDAGRLATCAWQ
jgi:hypothetical protein